MKNNTRKPGYYWVRMASSWFVRYWDGDDWLIPNHYVKVDDDDLSEINEVAIIQPNK